MMLEVTPTPIAGLTRVRRRRIEDTRGTFSRVYCADELSAAGLGGPLAQINHSHTARRGTVRGMHYQRPPHAEVKLVSCIRGQVWDVAVDLRAGSPTFLSWHAEVLSAENRLALLIPEGFAHGFQALSDDAELLYCHSTAYAQNAEGGLSPEDPALAIAWPLAVAGLSPRDASHPLLEPGWPGLIP